MQTIRELDDRIRQTQAKIDAENQAAERERDRAEEYRGAGDIAQATAHTQTSMSHEQKALQLQTQMNDFTLTQQQIQSQITELDRKQAEVQATKDQELSQINNQIDRLRGGA